MTSTRIEPVDAPTVGQRARPGARSAWRDALEATAWLGGTGALAFMLGSGSASIGTFSELMSTLGRATGIVAATMIMVQLLLASRAPVVERVVGHDRALLLHGRLGRIGFFMLAAHLVGVTVGYASRSGAGVLDQFVEFTLRYGGPMTIAVVGFAAMCLVIVTSLMAVRRRWSYESWHAVHLLSYGAIALTIPHQFLDGSTFVAGGFATWYWATLWAGSVVLFLGWRVVRPLVRFFRHDVRVADVRTLADGSAVVTLTGRHLLALAPRPGQFLLWRFLTPELWDEAHPYSLSRAPRDRWLRVTAKPLGDHSRALASLRPGTRVMVEGPLGTFHERTRVGRHLVLAGAGVGITPILAMLEGASFGPGECTVIVRASRPEDAVHLDEIQYLAHQRGATVHVLLGPRGAGWAPRETPTTLARLVPDVAHADVFACGPQAWTEAVFDDARRSGTPEAALHREHFAW